METIKYKDFIGSVEVSLKDNCVHGKILFINDLVTYESDTPVDLENKFKAAVDDYIETCKDLGIEPLKSFTGTFNIRIEPEKHQALAIYAVQNDITINKAVNKAILNFLNQPLYKPEVHNHQTINIVVEKPYSDFIPSSMNIPQENSDIIKFESIKKARTN